MADLLRLSKEAKDGLKLAATASVAAGVAKNVVRYVVSKNATLTTYLGSPTRQAWAKLVLGALMINLARGKSRMNRDLLLAGGTGTAISGAYTIIVPEVNKVFSSLSGGQLGYIAPNDDAGGFIPPKQDDSGVVGLNGAKLGNAGAKLNLQSALSS